MSVSPTVKRCHGCQAYHPKAQFSGTQWNRRPCVVERYCRTCVVKRNGRRKRVILLHRAFLEMFRRGTADAGTVTTLLDQGADINHRDWETGRTVLMLACEYSNLPAHFRVMQLLVERGANLDLVDHAGNSALHIILRVHRFDYTPIGVLLDAGIRVNHANKRGRTALMLACQRHPCTAQSLEAVQTLLAHGAWTAPFDNHGYTALMTCVRWASGRSDAERARRLDMARLLIDAASDVHHVSCVTGETAADLARGRPAARHMVDLLLADQPRAYAP